MFGQSAAMSGVYSIWRPKWKKLKRGHIQPSIGDLFSAAVALGAKIQMLPGPEGAWVKVNSPDQLMTAGCIEQQKHRPGCGLRDRTRLERLAH